MSQTPSRMSFGGSALPTLTPRARSQPTSSASTTRPSSSLGQNASSPSKNASIHSPVVTDDSTPTAASLAAAHKKLLRRPSGLTLRTSTSASAGSTRPVTPSSGRLSISQVGTPRTPAPARSKTPTGFGSSAPARGLSLLQTALEPGDPVKIEVGGEKMEGTLRFVGAVDGKAGDWGGVELDAEWAGQGKNDGSVKGEQYFACAPNCGLFLPLSKIHLKHNAPTTPSATSSARAPGANKLNQSARAVRTGPRPSLSPSKPAISKPAITPRRSMSPEKPSSASMSTPKARPRASLGGAALGSLPRKSAITPRASLGGPSSIRRPPSSLKTHSAPDVPPLPPNFSSRSQTPSSMSGRITPGLGHSATSNSTTRRMSNATDSSSLALSASRPTTPSVRSHSRQSFASSISRQSVSRASHHTTSTANGGEEALEDLRNALEESQAREEETRRLLDGSERVGREMEDKLAEKEDQLRAKAEQLTALEEERERDRVREAERVAGAGDDEKMRATEAAALRDLEEKVAELQKADSNAKATQAKLAREWETKFAAKESELEALRDRSALAAEQAQEDIADLNHQVESLRSAGQALCETYEERIAEIELSRLEASDLAQTLSEQLEKVAPGSTAALGLGITPRAESPGSPSTRLANSLGSSHASTAAEVIDAENAKAELEHMRSRVHNLEEQLEETRMHLEAEISDTKRRKQKANDSDAVLKKELKLLKDALDRSDNDQKRVQARIVELEDALADSQAALEEERSELEGLRHEGGGGVPGGGDEELRRAQKEVARAQREAEQANQEAARQAELIGELRVDLRTAEKELQKRSDHLTPGASPSQSVLSLAEGGSASPNGRRDSIASTGSRRRSTGPVKDEAATTKDTLVGLKVIISTLNDENAQLTAANATLTSETRDLKDAQRALEVTVENLMDQMSNQPPTSPPSAANKRRDSLQPSLLSLQREVDSLQSQLAANKSKSEKQVQALHQETSELEALLEAKIFREEELEGIIDNLRKGGASHNGGSNGSAQLQSVQFSGDEEGKCEMCGATGHELEDCPEFDTRSPAKPSGPLNGGGREGEKWCDDCEEYGHALEECPLANEIF